MRGGIFYNRYASGEYAVKVRIAYITPARHDAFIDFENMRGGEQGCFIAAGLEHVRCEAACGAFAVCSGHMDYSAQ
ncbi:MAG: hypothetical protein LRY51_18255 [Geovibrio sp.]|nr:hypothetical protein [Geovibrio sp.]